jgi:general secretion pathway protein D
MKILRDSLLAVFVICLLLISGYMPFTAVTDSLAETDVTGTRSVRATIEDSHRGSTRTEKRQSKDKKVSFNFVDVDISAVVKFISEVTGKNFVYDDKVKGTITIIAPSKLSMDDAFNLFTSVLELKGFTIIPSGKIYKIVPISQAKQSGTEIIKEGTALVSDTYIARLIQLKSISSSNAMNFLQPLISKDGHISSFGPGNMLMVVDAATNVEKVLEILEAIDKPGVEEPELILLKYANAEDVVKIITEAFKISSKTQQPSGFC